MNANDLGFLAKGELMLQHYQKTIVEACNFELKDTTTKKSSEGKISEW
jgi:hypothetical protein